LLATHTPGEIPLSPMFKRFYDDNNRHEIEKFLGVLNDEEEE
jgi:hypothetical protein